MSRRVYIGNVTTDADMNHVKAIAFQCGRVASIEAPSNKCWMRLTMSTPHAAVLLIQAIGPKTRDSKPWAEWALSQPVPRHIMAQRRRQQQHDEFVRRAADDESAMIEDIH